jgi:hypothetical protein
VSVAGLVEEAFLEGSTRFRLAARGRDWDVKLRDELERDSD